MAEIKEKGKNKRGEAVGPAQVGAAGGGGLRAVEGERREVGWAQEEAKRKRKGF